MKGTFKIGCGLLLFWLMVIASATRGQQTNGVDPLLMTGSDVSSLRSLTDEQLTNFVNELEATPTVPFGSLPRNGIGGTYWSLEHPEWPPLPADTSQSDAWQMSDDHTFLLSDLNFDYDAAVDAMNAPQARFSMDTPLPPGGSGGGAFTPGVSGPSISDFGTNLWIAQTAIGSGYLTGIGSNTLAGVSYTIQSLTNLLEPASDWQYEGTIVGSYQTNWTPLSVPQYNRTDLFLRLRSEHSSDGSGIPDWWEAQYGLSNVDPAAQDSAGDGYTIYQKYVLGINPNTFYTPAAPSGVMVIYSNRTAIISWLRSPGPVTGYSLEVSINGGELETNFNVSSTTTSVSLDISDIEPDAIGNDFPDIDTSATLTASYPGGDSTAANGGQAYILYIGGGTISLVQDNSGNANFAFSALPPNTTALQLVRNDFSAEYGYGDFSQNTNFNVSIVGITNGLAQIPAALLASPMDVYGGSEYHWYVQPVNSTGATTGHSFDLGYTENAQPLAPPFYDGSVQLKQNLIFLLRAGIETQFLYYNHDGAIITNPPAYAFSGLYDITYVGGYDPIHGNYDSYSPAFNYNQPFANNYTYRNFIFAQSDVNSSGRITNGFAAFNGAPHPLDLYTPRFQFTPPPTVDTIPLLATNDTKWLVTDLLDTGGGADGLIGLTKTPSGGNTIFTMGTSAQNWFGLPFISTAIAYGPNDAYQVNAGNSITVPKSGAAEHFVYPEVAQPKFQTMEYDFWNPAQFPTYDSSGTINFDTVPVPGIPGFATTNASARLILGVGSTMQVAGYAKLQVTNSLYSGVYGYLGQYFDQAYLVAPNGVATTNITGVLSPYGSFYASEPGEVALVTMPDIDSGARGTGIVECVSMNVDKNHDGTMDLSVNGPDATSEYSPMEFWVNDGNDQPNTSPSGGADFNAQVPSAPPNYAPSQFYPLGHISCPRDLENFGRLWMCGLSTLATNYHVTLSWYVTSGNPAINLYNSVETNGGIGYLTDTNIAASQCLASNVGASVSGEFGSITFEGPDIPIASITPSSSFTFLANSFTNAGNKYFLFEGAGIGSGELSMTITDPNGIAVAQTGVWLDLHNVKDFYERMVISNTMVGAISNWTSIKESETPAVVSDQTPDTNMIVFIHGANNPYWKYLVLGDTLYKRFYWQNYHGKIMTVRWPSPTVGQAIIPTGLQSFNYSEAIAYKAASTLKDYLNELHSRLPNYQLTTMSESLGGALVSEALREGGYFNNALLCSIAVSASCYDTNAPTDSDLLAADVSKPTPLWQPMGYDGVYTNLTTGHIVNYFNANDSLMSAWKFDQQHFKPAPLYTFDGTNVYNDSDLMNDILVVDSQESRALVARSRTLSIGAIGPASGQTSQGVIQSSIDVQATFNVGRSFAEHSAYYTRPIQSAWPLYDQYMESAFILTFEH